MSPTPAGQPSKTAPKKNGKSARLATKRQTVPADLKMTAFERKKFFPYPDKPHVRKRQLEILATLHREGWTVRAFKLPTALPFMGEIGGMWDHGYRLVRGSKTVYVGEPYRSNDAAMAQIDKMRYRGWNVTVHPDLALHYPGQTTAVWVHEPTTRS
jgi:hypothetical protein